MNRKTRFGLALLILQLVQLAHSEANESLVPISGPSNSSDPKSVDLSQSETAQRTVSTPKSDPKSSLKSNLTIFNVDQQVAFEGRTKIKVASSNYGIRVIKAPSLESLELDGRRLKELNSKLNDKLKLAGKAVKATGEPKSVPEAGQKERSPVKSFARQPKVKPALPSKQTVKEKSAKEENKQANDKSRQPSRANRFYSNQHQSKEKSILIKGLLPVQSAEIGMNPSMKQSAVVTQGYLPLQQQLKYQYGHHIDHTGNLYHNHDHPGFHEVGLRNQQNYHDLLNDKIEKTKDQMKYNLVHHHHRAQPNYDQINMKPLKVHLAPQLKDMHRPNKLWGHPKWPPSKFNQAAYNKKQRPSASLLKKQLEYRRNPYPHLKRFRHLVKLNGKSQGSKLDNFDYHQKDHHQTGKEHKDDLDDFDKEFDRERKFPNFNMITNLDQLPSVDFRSLAPVYVKNIDIDSFYKLNPYFTLPLPHM